MSGSMTKPTPKMSAWRSKKLRVLCLALAIAIILTPYIFVPTRSRLVGVWDLYPSLVFWPDGSFRAYQSRGQTCEGVWTLGFFTLKMEVVQLVNDSGDKTPWYDYKSLPVYMLGPNKLKIAGRHAYDREPLSIDEPPERNEAWPDTPRPPIPFFAAVYDADIARVTELLAEDPSLTTRTDRDGCTAVVIAAYMGDAKMLRLLLQNNADPNAVNVHGLTAMTLAILRHEETRAARIVELLLSYGADADIKSKDGTTALLAATKSNYHGIAALLRRDPDTSLTPEDVNAPREGIRAGNPGGGPIEILIDGKPLKSRPVEPDPNTENISSGRSGLSP